MNRNKSSSLGVLGCPYGMAYCHCVVITQNNNNIIIILLIIIILI